MTEICALREKCPYSEFFWSVFCHIRIEYSDQKNSKYGHFLRSGQNEYKCN